MAAATCLEALLGFILAVLTLRDVFDTVVIGVDFAPALLVGTFAVWMGLLVLGFGLMLHALGGSFTTPLRSFGKALYIAASALATTGVGNASARGAASVVVAFGGFCGLAVMTMAVTYLLEVQGNIAQRDTGVLKISTTAGQPPSALALLERYAALDATDDLAGLLRDARAWCAGVLQSHASHPWLIYFRSARTGSGWPAALGTLMDLALVMELLVEVRAGYGPAVLARQEADRLSREVVSLLRVQPSPTETRVQDVETLCHRLAAAGYALRHDRDLPHFARARDEQVRAIDALAQHLGMPTAPLLAPPLGAGTLRER